MGANFLNFSKLPAMARIAHMRAIAGTKGGAEVAELDIARPDNAAPDQTEVLEQSIVVDR